MVPADQRLESADLVAREIHHRLVIELELLGRQRLAQILLDDAAGLALPIPPPPQETGGGPAPPVRPAHAQGGGSPQPVWPQTPPVARPASRARAPPALCAP